MVTAGTFLLTVKCNRYICLLRSHVVSEVVEAAARTLVCTHSHSSIFCGNYTISTTSFEERFAWTYSLAAESSLFRQCVDMKKFSSHTKKNFETSTVIELSSKIKTASGYAQNLNSARPKFPFMKQKKPKVQNPNVTRSAHPRGLAKCLAGPN